MTRLGAALAMLVSVTACGGMQSALDPAGREAAWIAGLWWWMALGAVLIWTCVIVLALRYGRPHDAAPDRRRDRWLIVGAGVVFPVVVLTGLLSYGLAMIPPMVARAPAGSLIVEVEGELWWWRVRYRRPDGSAVELANEIRVPIGQPVQLQFTSDNVIHSFWVPALGGKMDVIPGRTTYLALTPTRLGTYSGACAEYCGTAHAFMRLYVQVLEPPAFEAWLARQSSPAVEPTSDEQRRGRALVLRNGCGACHTVRGTPADGAIAPDLTHVASRLSLAAGTLGSTAGHFGDWLAMPAHHKPGARMPGYRMLAGADLQAMATYLEGLR